MNSYSWQAKYEAAIACDDREELSQCIEEARVALSMRVIQLGTEHDLAEHAAIYDAIVMLAAFQTVLDAGEQSE